MSYLVQEETWIQKHSRTILAAISGIGALLTTYLTALKFSDQGAAFCTGEGGCDLVLDSRWSEIFGIPVAALGLLAYLVVIGLALVPDSVSPLIKKWRWPALFAVITGMVAFEIYMGYLMAAVLKQACFYCITSIVLVAALFGVLLVGHRWVDRVQLIISFVVLTLVTWVVTVGVYAQQPNPLALGLAQHLKQVGGTMYGAHWCPACAEQKDLFGHAAFEEVPYVECSPNGGRGTPPAQACIDAQIQSYPTWIIDEQRLRGVQSFEQLATASGYVLDGNS